MPLHGIVGEPRRVNNYHKEVVTDSMAPGTRVRKANQSHAFDSPMPGERRTRERPGQTENSR
jgi:hypothetical protein